MQRLTVRWFMAAGVGVLLATLLGGCEEDHHDRREASVVVADDFCCPVYSYLVEVSVCGRHGFPVCGARVDVIVAGYPEQRLRGWTDGDGGVFFQVETQAEVLLLATVWAEGYGEKTVDIGTRADLDYLYMPVQFSSW